MQTFGVKGFSWLAKIPNFDLSKGLVMDYMHCALLVVTRGLLHLWFDSKHHEELWYIGTKVSEVDGRLSSIRPPNEIQRTPRLISESLSYWKGN